MEDPRWHEAVRLLAAGRWFEAHEALEDLWRLARGRTRAVLQGLVHVAVALEHLRRGNPRGASSQWQKARARLAGVEDWGGIAVRAWLDELAPLLESADPRSTPRDVPPLPPEELWPRPRAANGDRDSDATPPGPARPL